MQSTLSFLGGAGSVTGSNFLLEDGDAKILIDCGLFQGGSAAEAGNWEPFAFDPASISVLINTHAHIDHIGRIPRLVKQGFKGKIISTEATKALAGPMLRDAMELTTRAAQHLHKEPLYEEADIEQALRQWEGVFYHQPQELLGGFTLEFLDSGHILGSAMAQLTRGGKKMIFTGDLGGGNSPLLPPCEIPQGADYLLMESVYGDKMHPQEDPRERLENIIEDTVARGGTLLVPAFSTERTQDLLFEIRSLMLEKRVPSVPVYLDSPLAEEITKSYLQYPQYFQSDIRTRIEGGEDIFAFPELHFVREAAESQKLEHQSGPRIILAGSGMSNGGRILGHERAILPDEKSTLLIVGYQAAGSLGRRLIEGAKTVEIHGEEIPVHCRVEAVYGYSAHMDSQQLLEFVNKTDGSLSQVFAVMGEPASAAFLVQRIRDYLGIRASAPEAGEKTTLEL